MHRDSATPRVAKLAAATELFPDIGRAALLKMQRERHEPKIIPMILTNFSGKTARGYEERHDVQNTPQLGQRCPCRYCPDIVMAGVKKKRGADCVQFIGKIREKFLETKLPTVREVQQVLLYFIRVRKETLKRSVWTVIRLVKTFWVEKSRIPIIHEMRIYDRIMCLYDEWGKVKRNHTRRNDSQKEREHKFEEKMDKLFDLAVPDAMELMTNDEDKKFLRAQRQPGRPGAISTSKDKTLAKQEQKVLKRKARMKQKKERERKFKIKHDNARSLLGEYQSISMIIQLHILILSYFNVKAPIF